MILFFPEFLNSMFNSCYSYNYSSENNRSINYIGVISDLRKRHKPL